MHIFVLAIAFLGIETTFASATKDLEIVTVSKVEVEAVSLKEVSLKIKGVMGSCNEYIDRRAKDLNVVVLSNDSNVYTSQESMDCRERDIVIGSPTTKRSNVICASAANTVEIKYRVKVNLNENTENYVALRFRSNSSDTSKELVIYRGINGEIQVSPLRGLSSDKQECGNFSLK